MVGPITCLRAQSDATHSRKALDTVEATTALASERVNALRPEELFDFGGRPEQTEGLAVPFPSKILAQKLVEHRARRRDGSEQRRATPQLHVVRGTENVARGSPLDLKDGPISEPGEQ